MGESIKKTSRLSSKSRPTQTLILMQVFALKNALWRGKCTNFHSLARVHREHEEIARTAMKQQGRLKKI
jgi:hypothetical protein